ALDFVAAEQPRGCTLDDAAVIALGNRLEKACYLSLGGSLRRGGLGFLLIRSTSKETGGDHQAQKQLIGIVGREHEVGLPASNDIVTLANQDGIAHNGAEPVDL